jgi:CHAT domain-containing protein
MHQLKFVVQVLKIGVDGSLWYVNDGATLANMQGFPRELTIFLKNEVLKWDWFKIRTS